MAARKTKLSQRQYLNAMTWVVSSMILIFVIVGKIMQDDDSSAVEVNLTYPFAEMNGLAVGEWRAYKTAQQWQQEPQLLTSLELRLLINAWQSLAASSTAAVSVQQPSLEIYVGISNEQQQWNLLLQPTAVLQAANTDSAIALNREQVALLFPQKILMYRTE